MPEKTAANSLCTESVSLPLAFMPTSLSHPAKKKFVFIAFAIDTYVIL